MQYDCAKFGKIFSLAKISCYTIVTKNLTSERNKSLETAYHYTSSYNILSVSSLVGRSLLKCNIIHVYTCTCEGLFFCNSQHLISTIADKYCIYMKVNTWLLVSSAHNYVYAKFCAVNNAAIVVMWSRFHSQNSHYLIIHYIHTLWLKPHYTSYLTD